MTDDFLFKLSMTCMMTSMLVLAALLVVVAYTAVLQGNTMGMIACAIGAVVSLVSFCTMVYIRYRKEEDYILKTEVSHD